MASGKRFRGKSGIYRSRKKENALLIAPASADVIGKLADGIADDIVPSVVLALGTSRSASRPR